MKTEQILRAIQLIIGLLLVACIVWGLIGKT